MRCPALKNGRGGGPRRRAQHVLVVAQIATSFLHPGRRWACFVQTLNRLHSVNLGYARENILLFSLNARQAGHRDPEIALFYTNLRRRFEAIPRSEQRDAFGRFESSARPCRVHSGDQ